MPSPSPVKIASSNARGNSVWQFIPLVETPASAQHGAIKLQY
jgi:hypothetical protein